MPTITISNRTFSAAALVLIAVGLVFVLRDVVVLLFVAVVLASALNPTITSLSRRGLSRTWSLILVAVGIVAVLTTMVVTIVPAIAEQFTDLINAAPAIIDRLASGTGLANVVASQLQNVNTTSISDIISRLGVGIFHGALGFIAGLLATISVLIITYYAVRDEQTIRNAIISVLPKKHHAFTVAIVKDIETRLGHWLRGQLFLGLIIGVASTAGLLLLHVKYAIALGLIAGVTELIPTIGPYLGMIPAALVGLSQSPATAVWVVSMYTLIQQAENNFLVPRIMSKATGLNPIAVLIGILVGAKLGGILGILLAIPGVIIISAIGNAFLAEKEELPA